MTNDYTVSTYFGGSGTFPFFGHFPFEPAAFPAFFGRFFGLWSDRGFVGGREALGGRREKEKKRRRKREGWIGLRKTEKKKS